MKTVKQCEYLTRMHLMLSHLVQKKVWDLSNCNKCTFCSEFFPQIVLYTYSVPASVLYAGGNREKQGQCLLSVTFWEGIQPWNKSAYSMRAAWRSGAEGAGWRLVQCEWNTNTQRFKAVHDYSALLRDLRSQEWGGVQNIFLKHKSISSVNSVCK